MQCVAADASLHAECEQRAGGKLGALSQAARKPQGSSNTRKTLSTVSASPGCAPKCLARDLWRAGVCKAPRAKTPPARQRQRTGGAQQVPGRALGAGHEQLLWAGRAQRRALSRHLAALRAARQAHAQRRRQHLRAPQGAATL